MVAFLKLRVKSFYYQLKRINWVTEIDKNKPVYHYMSPGSLKEMDRYKKILNHY